VTHLSLCQVCSGSWLGCCFYHYYPRNHCKHHQRTLISNQYQILSLLHNTAMSMTNMMMLMKRKRKKRKAGYFFFSFFLCTDLSFDQKRTHSLFIHIFSLHSSVWYDLIWNVPVFITIYNIKSACFGHRLDVTKMKLNVSSLMLKQLFTQSNVSYSPVSRLSIVFFKAIFFINMYVCMYV
jgi:hypothetical protein